MNKFFILWRLHSTYWQKAFMLSDNFLKQIVKGFLLLFSIICVFVWIYSNSILITIFIKVEISLEIYFAYKVMSKISKIRRLSKKLCKRVIIMISRGKIVRRLKSVVAVEINRGIQIPSFAFIWIYPNRL